MDPIFFRGTERLIISIGGIVFAYLGYKLYRHGIVEGLNKVTIESKLGKLLLSGVGPGLFFMVFGSFILIAALYFGGVQITDSTKLKSQDTRLNELQDQQHRIAAALEHSKMISMRLEAPPEKSASAEDISQLEARISKLEEKLRYRKQ